MSDERPPLPLDLTLELDRIRRRSAERSTATKRRGALPRTGAAPKPPRPPATHCPNGHEFTEANTYYSPSRPNARRCRSCIQEQGRKARSGD